MYMVRFQMRMTLLPTAPSMFQNQKLREITEDVEKNETPEKESIEAFIPKLAANPEEAVPENTGNLEEKENLTNYQKNIYILCHLM